jgi:thioredoxin-related protein
MKNKSSKKILLFLKRNSVYFSTNINDFKKIMDTLSKMPLFNVEVIDITKNPELAEKYKIDALPTLIIGDKKYIGVPNTEKTIDILKKEYYNT